MSVKVMTTSGLSQVAHDQADPTDLNEVLGLVVGLKVRPELIHRGQKPPKLAKAFRTVSLCVVLDYIMLYLLQVAARRTASLLMYGTSCC